MTNKKYWLIGIIFILLAGLGYLSVFTSQGPKVLPTPTPTPYPRITYIPTITLAKNKIVINNIEINNFYPEVKYSSKYGEMVVAENDDFQIVYHSKTKQFLISITSAPFATLRQKAEQELLDILDLTGTQACNLDVVVTTVQFANPEFAGQSFPLSFCQ